MTQIVNLNFHQTFRPEKQYVSAILELAGNNEKMSVKKISSLTGIPQGESSGKVEPHIIYAYYMGLIKYKKNNGEYLLYRTALGSMVYSEDPGLQEKLTILLCHCMMQREEGGAPLWATIIRNILPSYRGIIKKDMLLKELEKNFNGKTSMKNSAPFFGSYDSFFDNIDLLQSENDEIRVNPLKYNKEFIYLYAYIFLLYWEEKYSGQDEITSIELENMRYGNVFGWDTQNEYSILEYLADQGIIRMNRQLMPYTILKLAKADDLLENLYSELC